MMEPAQQAVAIEGAVKWETAPMRTLEINQAAQEIGAQEPAAGAVAAEAWAAVTAAAEALAGAAVAAEEAATGLNQVKDLQNQRKTKHPEVFIDARKKWNRAAGCGPAHRQRIRILYWL